MAKNLFFVPPFFNLSQLIRYLYYHIRCKAGKRQSPGHPYSIIFLFAAHSPIHKDKDPFIAATNLSQVDSG